MLFILPYWIDLFGTPHGWGGGGAKKLPSLKSVTTYPTVMKLSTVKPYLKKIQIICQSRYATLEFCWQQYFFTGNQQLLLYQEIQI